MGSYIQVVRYRKGTWALAQNYMCSRYLLTYFPGTSDNYMKYMQVGIVLNTHAYVH